MAAEHPLDLRAQMKVVVLGLWHLGCVTAASCAKHFDVVALDLDGPAVDSIRTGKLPISEPGLDALFKRGLESGRLKIVSEINTDCEVASVLWVAYDTPVDVEDRPDVDFVLDRIRRVVPLFPASTPVLISSQLPAGTCQKLEGEFPGRNFACSPENLRLGRSIEDFNEPSRIVVGCRTLEVRDVLARLFQPFCSNVIWMNTESAEMTKHAINAFLAASVVFTNEIARLCEVLGADAKEVEQGLRSDLRIGPGAYVSPGAAFAGGTLARDVVALTELSAVKGESLFLIPAIKHSNDRHKMWALEKLRGYFEALKGKKIGVLGLAYKSGTDTLRRSQSLELCRRLVEEGCEVSAFDPAVEGLPDGMSWLSLQRDIRSLFRGRDAVVVFTVPPDLLKIPWKELVGEMQTPFVCDANGLLRLALEGFRVHYCSVGNQR